MDSWNSSRSASAFLDFYVDKKALKEPHAIAAHNFTGSQLRTKIKGIVICQWVGLAVGGADSRWS